MKEQGLTKCKGEAFIVERLLVATEVRWQSACVQTKSQHRIYLEGKMPAVP